MEKIKVTKFEQNCITIEIGEAEYYVFDAGSEASLDRILLSKRPTATFVSHSHGDHFDTTNLKNLNCQIYGAKEVVEGLHAESLSAIELFPNKEVVLGNLHVTPFNVDHGAISAPIVNLGFHILAGGKSILFLGDIAIPSPIPISNFDLIFVPVGGSKVFDVNQASDFIKSINYHGLVIPMHFHGRADRASGINFKEIASTICDVRVLDVGESIKI